MADHKGVANSDWVADEQFPNIFNPPTTNAPGSVGSRTPSPAAPLSAGAESGIPGVGTIAPLNPTYAESVNQPGQTDDGLTGVTTEQITQTGAGKGHTLIDDNLDRAGRGQQPAGG